MKNGVRVSAWTFDELYGRGSTFLDGLEKQKQAFIGEIPVTFHGWMREPEVVTKPLKNKPHSRSKQSPHLEAGYHSSEVRNLAKHSPAFRKQAWEPYRIKDSNKGPVVWEIKWAKFWRKDAQGWATKPHCLIVARNVLTGEEKYFLSNCLPGDKNPATGECVTLCWLLRVAFGRWSIESCFRETKEELGLDHFECRGWGCIHRHYRVTQISHLFCARMRQKFEKETEDKDLRVTVEQVRSAINVFLDAVDLPPRSRRQRFEKEIANQTYHQHRNDQACKSHTQTRIKQLQAIGINVEAIKSCIPDT